VLAANRKTLPEFLLVASSNAYSTLYDAHSLLQLVTVGWIGLSSVLRPRQHSIGYMGDGFYRSKDPTNSIKVLKEMLQRKKQKNENN